MPISKYRIYLPTPISALLHAATMVTAGVFLLLRLSLLLSFSYYSLIMIIIIGSLTTFIGGTLALTSLDMKELIAYSTMSQLGLRIYHSPIKILLYAGNF
jgi:NADH:ubiquinone oxidoreductase subunit 5 (subunit L)/multisubunit Na+/H+ antiporter MnhA subunit